MEWFEEKYEYKGYQVQKDWPMSGFSIRKDGERVTEMQMATLQACKNVINTYLNSIGDGEYGNYSLPIKVVEQKTIQHHFKLK